MIAITSSLILSDRLHMVNAAAGTFSTKNIDIFSYFSSETGCGYSLEAPRQKRLAEALLMRTHSILSWRNEKLLHGYLLLSGAIIKVYTPK